MPTTLARERWLLLTLAGVQFTHILDFMVMMPLGPQLTRWLQISDAQFGLLVSAYTFAAGASGLLASTYLDRFDRKQLLLVLYGLFALSTLACGLAPNYGSLMVARVAAGASGGVLTALTQTIVADVVPFERRGRAMAVVMSAFSVSTVAGVPISLWLASVGGWSLPFEVIAGVSLVLAAGAAWTLPPLRAHLQAGPRVSPWQGIARVLQNSNHRCAWVFTALMMFSGFTVIPYITLFLQANVGLTDHQQPWIYLCGGAATLVSARVLGRLTDRHGKVPTYTGVALLMLVPLFAITLLGRVPLPWVLVVTTAFFVLSSGRMIPAMAIVTSAAEPAVRGTFMAFHSSVQSAAMGAGTVVGGLILSRDAQGALQHYWLAACVGAVASLTSLWVVRRLTLHGAPGVQKPSGKP